MNAARLSKLARSLRQIGFLVFAVALQGCGKEEIRVYKVAKEVVAEPPSAAAWTLPAGWIEQQAGGMRVGSFHVEGADGESADVSVIPLSVTAGTDLDNLNRWRVQQLGLPAMDAKGMSETKETVSIGGVEASMFDLLGKDPNSDKPTRILAVISRTSESTWFFKMIGPDKLVAGEKSSFVQFLQSFSFPGTSAPRSNASVATQDRSVQPQRTGVSSSVPSWIIPTSWQEQAPTSMLLAKFVVEDNDLGKAEVTISAFPGDVGGLLANVNRWRTAQLGLGAVNSEGLTGVTSSIIVSGETATLVDMANSDSATPASANRILVAVVPHKGKTWFFKILGSEQLVVREKPGFVKFLQSIKFPNVN